MAEYSFSLRNCDEIQCPVLISVPHAGRDYPAQLRENLNVPPSHLRRLEDRYSDLLASRAIKGGIPTIIARQPRAWVDLNRAPSEIDIDLIAGLSRSHVGMPSRKVRGGLGLIPRRLSGIGELWRDNWEWDEIADRIERDHEPYHAKIADLLRNMRYQFGRAILLDLHSMPPLETNDGPQPGIVVGDRFGRSSGSRYSELAMANLKRSGFDVRLNHPYAGGYILERHGHPEKGIHAIQIEVDRSFYLERSLQEPSQGLNRIAAAIESLACELADSASGQVPLQAAE